MPNVLVVDDSRLIREAIRTRLVQDGYLVTVAGCLDEGLLSMRRDRPAVVVLDQDMASHDGLKCLKKIRSDPATAGIPVLMLTTAPVRDAIVRLARLGVQGVIVKNGQYAAEVQRRIAGLTGSGGASVSAPTAVTSANSQLPARPFGDLPAAVDTRGGATLRTAMAVTPQEDTESLRASVLQLEGDPLQIEHAIQELKLLKPLMSRSEILERVTEGSELKALKPAVQQVLHLAGGSSASLDTIAKAIKQDQALSLKVLKIANSPLYLRGERVETVQKAVARIGLEQIRTTVMSLSVIDRFGDAGLAGRIKADWFWEHAITCGLIAAKIAALRGFRTEAVDSMFTAGLLHDVGRAIYAERMPQQYAGVIEVADELELPLETVESRLMLVNHADLTDRLLRSWNFSVELINPIALHHLSLGNIRRVAPKMAEAVATLGLANRLAHALVLGGSGNEVLYPIEEFVEFLRLTPETFQELVRTIPDQALDVKLQMLQHGADSQSSLLDEVRRTLRGPVRPLLVGMQPAMDAIGILLARIGEIAPAGEPNLAVVRVTQARDRAQIMSMLKATDSRSGRQRLPTLVVGTGPGCLFADGVLGDRPVTQVVMPVRLSRLLRQINTVLLEDAK